MLAFLKNTVAQINAETRQGNAPVMRALEASSSATSEPVNRNAPARVDAVTGGTQGIASYFAGRMQPLTKKPDST